MKYSIFATSFFEKKLKYLSRKFRRIFSDYEKLLGTLEENPYLGDRIPKVIIPTYKIRMMSQDMAKGKRGGFRVIYIVRDFEKEVYLLTIYPKNEIENIEVVEINRIIKEMGLQKTLH